MLHQIIEIQEENRYVSLDRGFLKIRSGEEHIANVPLDDIAVLLVSAQSVSLSKHVLNELAERGGITILCGKNYTPQSIVMPVSGHYQQAGIIKTQVEASLPLKKNIWKQIVEVKLQNQVKSLSVCGRPDSVPLLQKIARMVKSGDPDNREAYGARMYWKALFGPEFIRDKDSGGINALLNYGYAVVRASMARAVCSAGLLPSLGIHHDNQLNPFCLADDFFEPFRPVVDCIVYQIIQDKEPVICPEIKQTLIRALWVNVHTSEGCSPLFQSMHYMVNSYVKSLKQKKPQFMIPEWEGKDEEFSCSEQV